MLRHYTVNIVMCDDVVALRCRIVLYVIVWTRLKPCVCFSQAEENRQREHRAATGIQSWFRVCKARARLRYDAHARGGLV